MTTGSGKKRAGCLTAVIAAVLCIGLLCFACRFRHFTTPEDFTAAGYQHYEISNFSLPGFRSRHNSSYWTGVPYIGLGAAAHSYDGQRRLWNPDNLLRYTKGIEDGKTCYEGEELTADTRYNDHVMLSLRTCEGLDIDTLSDSERAYLLPLAAKYIDNGLLLRSGNYLRLSRQGLFVSDMIMSDLMIV